MQKPFPSFSVLPWILAAIFLVVYLVTLHPFVSLSSLATANDIAQWEPVSATTRPLLWLLTRPVSWLGGSAQFPAMNLLAAVLAAATVAQLARTVSLLPHDRTREQRNRETHERGLLSIPQAWVPPVVAAMVCGFQLTFWEHATALTGEMLALLVFAVCVRCLMESRLSSKPKWTNLLALVYGLGLTNNAAMIAFFPFFLVALLWIKGMTFFQFPFLVRTTLFGVVGLSLYLLLPVVAAFKATGDVTFWTALKTNLVQQKQTVLFPFATYPPLRLRLIIMSLTSLVPLIMIGFRWPSMTTETSSLGRNMLGFLFGVAAAAFVVAGIAVAYDLPFSPREIGYGFFPYLTVYYLGALSVGYFTGFLLLIFLAEPETRWQRSKPGAAIIGKVLGYATLAAVIVAPLVLAARSWKEVAVTNGPALYQSLLAKIESLPPEQSVLLSDDGSRLILLRAALQKSGQELNPILIDTAAVRFGTHLDKLRKRHPEAAFAWPDIETLPEQIENVPLLRMVLNLEEKLPVFYLHPSFGYYFEEMRPVPVGGLTRMIRYAEDQPLPAPLTDAELASTTAYWDKLDAAVLAHLPAGPSKSPDAAYLKRILSAELNGWGVTLQQLGKLKEAEVALSEAVRLQPMNPLDPDLPGNHAAETTLAFNRHLQNPGVPPARLSQFWSGVIAEPAQLQRAMNAFGPVDEPETLVRIGSLFSSLRNRRQGLVLLLRAKELAPQNSEIPLALAKTYIELGRADEALRELQQLRALGTTMTKAQEVEALNVEALSLAVKGNFSAGEAVLQNALNRDRDNIALQTTLISYYLATKQIDTALRNIDQRIAENPRNEFLLLDKSAILIGLNRFQEALAPLDTFLAKNPEHQSAILNKAIALFRLGQYAASKAEYEKLVKLSDKPLYQAHFGLSGIAVFQKDTTEAIRQSELYLAHAPKMTREYVLMQAQLEELKKSQ